MPTVGRPRLRRLLKWGGLGLSLLLAVAWTTSLWWMWGFNTRTGGPYIRSGFEVVNGALCISYGNDVSLFYDSALPPNVVFSASRKLTPWFQMQWVPYADHSLLAGGQVFVLPLWISFLLIALPTTLRFRRGGRRKRGQKPFDGADYPA